MTTQEIYKQGLNDILNSKSKDVSVLRKIALKAFTQPIKDIADSQPMYWKQYEGEKFDWHLIVNEVFIACLCDEEMDNKKWILRDYDTDFAPIFGDGSMPEFDSLEEGKKYCEMRFLLWLKDVSSTMMRERAIDYFHWGLKKIIPSFINSPTPENAKDLYGKYELELLNSGQKVQECDARDDAMKY